MSWKNSVYSDSSLHFVSNPRPTLNESITIRLQMIDNQEVKGVQLRLMKNGEEHIEEMILEDRRNGLIVYSGTTHMNQPKLNYHFIIYTTNCVYFYNQLELTEVIPTEDYDFKLISDYQGPEWVKKSVFYQIFPDRFSNGNSLLDVKDNEYEFDGHSTVHMEWNEKPKAYDQVFCLDFYGGDLVGIKDKIPYLQEMGMNALYINPIFMSATSHRYDCLDYFQVDPHLGGNEALSELTEALHQQDMKVIIDVSINHTGTAHKWFNKEGTFFDKSIGGYNNKDSKERNYYFFDESNNYRAWFDVPTLPTLNYTSDELKTIIYEGEDALVKTWIKPPYNIDGWRFDVASTMARQDNIQLSRRVWDGIRESIRSVKNDGYIVGEHWTDCNEYLQGDQWDTAMNYFGCTRPIRHFVGDSDLFLARNAALSKMKIKLTAKNLKDRIMQHYSRIPYQVAATQYNLIDSHDVYRLHNLPGLTFGAYSIAITLMYMLPGAPSVYYGDEIGLEGEIDTIEGCRYPMVWNEAHWKESYVELYKTLSVLKRTNPCLHDGGFKFVYDTDFIIGLTRFTQDQVLLQVGSMEDEEKTIILDLSTLGVDKNWENEVILGSTEEIKIDWTNQMLSVTIKGKSNALIQFKNVGVKGL